MSWRKCSGVVESCLLCWFRIVRNFGQALSRILAFAVVWVGASLRRLCATAIVHPCTSCLLCWFRIVPRQPFGSLHLCIDSHLCRCICAMTAICAVASVHRQPFVPLHRATALCGCLYASLHNGFVRPLSCILCTFMNALLVSHRASSAVWVATSCGN